MFFSREATNIFYADIFVCSLIVVSFSFSANATESEHRVEALGILMHLACHTSSQDERRRLEKFGYDLGVDALLDDRYPVRIALREIQKPEFLDWGARARQVFLEIGANPVTIHVAMLELQTHSYLPAEVVKLFSPPHLQKCWGFIPKVNVLITEFLESCGSREGGFASLMGNMEILDCDRVQDLQEKIEKVVGVKPGIGHQRSTKIIVNPYLPALTGFNAAVRNDERWVVIGPSPDDTTHRMLLAHELLHVPVHALMNKIGLRWKIFKNRHKFISLKKAGHITQGYSDWRSYLEEGIVRALSYEVAGIPCRDTGFLLERICQMRLSAGDTGPLELVSAITSVLDDTALLSKNEN